jgi:putative LysE/RhtB family amino acid efflux pump
MLEGSLLALVAKGMGLGLAVAAPVGPMSMLCIRRTLDHGPGAGLAAGFGIALADGLYGLIAALGFTSLAGVLVAIGGPLQVVGGLFLLWLAWRMFRAPPPVRAATARPSRFGAVGSTFALTLTNPSTILSFVGMFAGLGVAGDRLGSLAVAGGVFAGSILWWLVLIGAITLAGRLAGERLTAAASPWIGRVAALGIALFGLVALWHGVPRTAALLGWGG